MHTVINYEHDGCSHCRFVGNVSSRVNWNQDRELQEVDVWICFDSDNPHPWDVSVMFRFSSEPGEYLCTHMNHLDVSPDYCHHDVYSHAKRLLLGENLTSIKFDESKMTKWSDK